MTTYDNLNIAQTTLIFQMVGGVANSSISSGIFDLSSLVFLPNVPLIDQIEVERIFDTGEDTKFNPFVFTIANRREMFIFPKDWYTINEQTKVLTFKNLSTIPVYNDGQGGGNGLYYPYSRTYQFASGPDLDIPVVQAISTQIGTVVRNADIVYIRRKTPSINSIVTFAPGTRLTTTQLNLQFNQLKYIVQELVARIKNEAILKYDENAIDGPFLGQGDLKMNGNSLKDLGSLSITTMGTSVSEANSNLTYSAKDFAASVDKVYEAVTSGTVYRSGLAAAVGSKAFTGDFTASNAKIINVANGSADSDAATFGQVGNASNLITGTLPIARIDDGTLPLEKLSSTWVSYTLPSAALPTILSNNSWGSSTSSNTNNMVFITTDTKGRISAITQRDLATADLPTISGVAGTYGDGSTVLTQITVDSTGRITAAQENSISASNISSVNAGAVSGALVASNLPLVSAGGGGATTVTSIPNSITVDTLGRVTAVSGGSITASNVSDFATAANARIDARGLSNLGSSFFDATSKKISNVVDPASDQDVVTRKYFTDNSIALISGNYSIGNKPITGLTMRASGDLTANDAVNFGYIQALTLYGPTTDPQTFTNAWTGAGTATGGNLPYEFPLATLAATTAEMVIVTDSQGRIYIPSITVPTVAGRFFRLDTSVSPKKIIVYLESTTSPTGSVYIRNFGTSRSVAGNVAGATTLGLVQVPTTGGLLIDSTSGNLTLNTATVSQLGGVKIDTTAGLTNTSGSISVTRSDSTSSNSTTTLANSKAVNDLKGLSMLLDGTQTMTGKLTTATPSTNAGLNLPSGTAGSPVTGDVWNQGGTLKMRTDGSTTKDIAFTGSNITGNAATATKLAATKNITLSGAVTSTGTAFDGSGDITISTALASSAAVTSLSSSTITVSASTGAVTLSLPQSIATNSAVTFGSATLGNINISSTANTIATSATNNLILAPATAATTVTGSLAVSTALTVGTTSGLSGAVTLGSTLALSVAGAKIALGNATAASATTSINLGSGASGTSSTGDLILRVPTGRLAHLVANDTPTFAPTSNDLIITKGVMDTAITTATNGFMSSNGATRSTAGDQTLGVGTDSGSFLVKTGLAPTTRLTIANSGAATFANALTVSSGGLNIVAGGLTAVGTTSLTGTVTINNTVSTTDGVIIAAQAPSQGSHLTNKTYVDQVALYPYVDVIDSTTNTTPTFLTVSTSPSTANSPFNLRSAVTVGETYWYKARFTGNDEGFNDRDALLLITYLFPNTYNYQVILGQRSSGLLESSAAPGNQQYFFNIGYTTTGAQIRVAHGNGDALTKDFWYGIRVVELKIRPGMTV
jgi:hypothetical protein